MIRPSRTVSVAIDAPFQKAYDYISDASHLPQWAPGFFRSMRLVDGKWIAETTLGPAGFRFADRNPFGVLDHFVTLGSEPETANSMRLIPNGGGCELLFTLFRSGDMTEAQFQEDAETVLKDLRNLKAILEPSPA